MGGKWIAAGVLWLLCSGAALTAPAQAGQYVEVYGFKGGTDGDAPAGLLAPYAGRLLGTTHGGGDAPGSNGAIFALNPATGAKTTVYSFRNQEDGRDPYSGLTASNGLFYGLTADGGAGSGRGTLYSLNPTTGVVRTLVTFHGGVEGAQPSGNLLAVGGTLFGVTARGGGGGCGGVGCGTLFAFTPSNGQLVTLRDFPGGSGGAFPQGGVIAVGGALFGVTYQGGGADQGAIYTLNPATRGFRVLHSFQGGPGDGANPTQALLNLGGTLYGTTVLGGAQNRGTVFAINAASGETVLHSFIGGDYDGALPSTPLVRAGGRIYGATVEGGHCPCGQGDRGTLFSFDPATGDFRDELNFFPGATGGAFPTGGLLPYGGALYGTTVFGGSGLAGVVYAFRP